MPTVGREDSSQNQLEKEVPLAGSLADRNAAVPDRNFLDEVPHLASKHIASVSSGGPRPGTTERCRIRKGRNC